MTDERSDDELGAAMRGLGVPEHRQGFWERLDRRIGSEQPAEGDGRGVRRAGGMGALARYLPLVIALLVMVVIVVLLVVG